MATTTEGAGMFGTEAITPLHVERARQFRAVVRHDIAYRGMSADESMRNLATYLTVDLATVKLAVAIANEADAS
jgi:hypothetical protein